MTFACIGFALLVFALVGGLTGTEGSDGQWNWLMSLIGIGFLVAAVVKALLF